MRVVRRVRGLGDKCAECRQGYAERRHQRLVDVAVRSYERPVQADVGLSDDVAPIFRPVVESRPLVENIELGVFNSAALFSYEGKDE